ncbi:MAG TPA: GxxExxY protein [Candidatus Angelobacter sp.]|nr:GxxExxY protein [Candidatus Angelobacter sp.]
MMSSDQPRINANEHERKHWDLCHQIVGIFYSVYNELGYGFLEAVYEEALSIGLAEAGLSARQQVSTPIWFHGRTIGEYKADIVVNNLVLLELKAAKALDASHEAQILNYLRATNIEVGLLLNFGPKPHFKRFVFENNRKGIRVHSRAFAAK